MKNYKNSFKLLKYDFQLKVTIIAVIFFLVMAVGYSVGNAQGADMVGAYYWGPFMGIFPLQSLYNVLYAKYVVSSPKYREYIVKGTMFLHGTFMMFMYLICIVLYYYLSRTYNFQFDVKTAVFSFLAVDLGLAIYIQVYYRNMILGIVAMIPALYVMFLSNNPNSKILKFINNINLGDVEILIVGAVGVLVCEAILYWVALLLYKIPFSDSVMKRMLSKVR